MSPRSNISSFMHLLYATILIFRVALSTEISRKNETEFPQNESAVENVTLSFSPNIEIANVTHGNSVTNHTERLLLCEKALYDRLNNRYLQFDPPPQPNEEYSYVKSAIQLYGLQTVSEVNSQVKISIVYSNYWNDSRLSWSLQVCNRSRVALPPDVRLWYPQYIVLNQQEGVDDFSDQFTKMHFVRNTGYVGWLTFSNTKISCTFDYTLYPADETTCYVDLYYYGLNIMRRDTPRIGEIWNRTDLTHPDWFSHPSWDVIRTSYEQHPNNHSGNTRFEFVMKRRPMFATVTMLVPLAVLCPLPTLPFLLPSDSGEKMGVSLATLLTYFVMGLSFFNGIPAGVTFPWLGIAFLYLLTTAGFATFFTAAVLTLDNSGKNNSNKHAGWARKLNWSSLLLFVSTNVILPVITLAYMLNEGK